MPIELIIAGVPLTPAQLLSAADVLDSARGHHVSRPLARARHPLSRAQDQRWYHEIHKEEIRRFPELRVPPGGVHGPHRAQVKPAVSHCLRRLAAAVNG